MIEMVRYCYENNLENFRDETMETILGEITKNYKFELNEMQKKAWISEIKILKNQLSKMNDGTIIFEYQIPRMQSIIDNVLLINGIIFAIEFKINEKEYKQHEIEQVLRYTYQLKNFHYESRKKLIVPILVCTEAEDINNDIKLNEDNVFNIIKANKNNLSILISEISEKYKRNYDLSNWSKSKYVPTPNILEAARKLYETHEVSDIKEHNSVKDIFVETEKCIDEIITNSKENHKKSIIFLNGVPGAGKTLVGLNIATKRSINNEDNAVFLSGNKPLVDVLKEALARDSHNRKKSKTITESRTKVSSFIQPIYSFREDALNDGSETHEKIVIFDEAQRAWNKDQTEKFMKDKHSIENFDQSEPEFLISIMDRHKDWAVIICLIGQGQEINKGEAGINEWYDALNNKYQEWDIYSSENINKDHKYRNLNIIQKKELFLGIAQRSVEAPTLPQFIEYVLNNNIPKAKKVLNEFNEEYPLFITRDLKKAKSYIKDIVSDLTDEKPRYGLLAQSNAIRLIPEGIFVKNQINVKSWFLDNEDDIRSSNHMEISASEFDIQGLEIDYGIMAWDANLRYNNGEFEYYKFSGTRWNNISKNKINRTYLINSYRVLLTRSRSGMVIFIPEGDDNDKTRLKEYYDGTYNYLKEIGIKKL